MPCMSATADHQHPLRQFAKSHDFFIGIDSDGCAFDTMEVKHKECFIPNIIKFYRLAAISKYVREVAEFLNLYSKWRGINRFPGLVLMMDMLAERARGLAAASAAAGAREPAGLDRRGDPALEPGAGREGRGDGRPRPRAGAAMERGGQPIDRRDRDRGPSVPAGPRIAREHAGQGRRDGGLGDARRGPRAGMARARAARARGAARRAGAGEQERAPGPRRRRPIRARQDPDGRRRARATWRRRAANGVLFYPIDPGGEDESWQRFFEEALPRFFAGNYAGEYMDAQLARFLELLPERPPWKRD